MCNALYKYVALLFITIACSCTNNSASQEKVQKDSISYDLKIATLPTYDALPLYLAQETGLFDSLELKVQLIPHKAQFDCDTALLNGWVDIALMDKSRQTKYQAEGHSFQTALEIQTPLALLAAKDTKFRSVKSLVNQTVAISRQSADESFCLRVLTLNGISPADVHYPQINNIALRTAMLNNRQVDAAVIPEPFATMAQLEGHTLLYSGKSSSESANQIVCLTENPAKQYFSKLATAYQTAQETIKAQGLKTCKNILIRKFRIPSGTVDSLTAK